MLKQTGDRDYGHRFSVGTHDMKFGRMAILIGAALISVTGCSKSKPTAAGESGSTPDATSPGVATVPAGGVLVIRWTVGDRLLYRMDVDQQAVVKMPQMPKPMEQDVAMGLTYAVSVTKENGDGGRELEVEFVAQEMDVKVGGQTVVSFDSKENTKRDAQNPLAAPLRKMMGSRVRFQTDATAKVVKLLNFEEWRSEIQDGIANQARQIFDQTYNEGYLRQIVDFGSGMPGKAVAVGGSWPVKMDVPAGPVGTVNLDLKSTLRRSEVHEGVPCAVIDSAGTMTSSGGKAPGLTGNMKLEKGTVTGTNWLDVAKGVMVESVSTQTMRIVGSIPGGNEADFSSDITQNVTVKLVEQGKVGK